MGTFFTVWKRLHENFVENPTIETIAEVLFRIKERNTTIKTELICGIIHFLTVSSVLAVNPSQLAEAGYVRSEVASGTAIASAITCIFTGLVVNVPFVSTPTLATSIYLSVFLKNNELSPSVGNSFVLFVGIMLIFCTIRSVSRLVQLILPKCVQLGIFIGLSLLISLTALSNLGLVVPGKYTILMLGEVWTLKVVIAIVSFILIGIMKNFEIKGSYVIGLLFGSIAYWLFSDSWPKELLSTCKISFNFSLDSILTSNAIICIIDMFMISAVLVAGMAANLATLSGLEREDGNLPRSRWLYFSCGIGTIVGSVLGSGVIIPSAESAVGILSGARTGLSTLTCGLLFIISSFFYPIWSSIPIAGTAPVLLMVGVLLFKNNQRVDWENCHEALTIYITAIFTAFTYSIFHGVLFGGCIYIIMLIATGDVKKTFSKLHDFKQSLDSAFNKLQYQSIFNSADGPYREISGNDNSTCTILSDLETNNIVATA